jgi:hypothetical protein
MRPSGPMEPTATAPDSTRPSEAFSKAIVNDINLAARAHTPVLITAAPDHALSIARVIATGGRGDCTPEVLTCDPTAGDDVLAAMADDKLTSPEGHAPILLLKEVQGLTTSDQAAVLKCLDRQQKERSGRAPRVIASTSIDLFGCVERGTFDAQLFYRLNAIHIAVPSR